MQVGWTAHHFASEGAPAFPTRVTIDPAGLHFQTAAGPANWPFTEVVQTSGAYAGEKVCLERAGQILVLEDRQFLQMAVGYAPQFRLLTPDPPVRRSVAIIVGANLLLLVALLVGAWLLLTRATQAAVRFIPISWEKAAGRTIFEAMAPASSLCTDTALTSSVDAILQRLKQSQNSGYDFHLAISDTPAVNALAAPGGYIVVYRGLLRLADSPEEAAGVLAHEMQHVIQRHSTRGLLRSAGIRVFAAMLLGDAGALAGTLGDLSFQRGDEEEADMRGIELIQAARIDPQGTVRIFEKLAQESGNGPEFLSTHPDPGSRAARLSAAATARSAVPIHTSEPWSNLRERCR